MSNTAIIISVCALFFTIYSFWWMNWRIGKLNVSYIKHIGIYNDPSKFYIELPLIFFNTGALPVVVESLRLIFFDKNNLKHSLHFNATRTGLGIEEGREYATPFSINKGDSVKKYCEFQKNPSDVTLVPATYRMKLEGKLSSKKDWKTLRYFEISISSEKLEGLQKHYEYLEELK